MHTQRRMRRSIRADRLVPGPPPKSRPTRFSETGLRSHANESDATRSDRWGPLHGHGRPVALVTHRRAPQTPGRCPDTMRPRNFTAGGTMVSCGASEAITSERRGR